MGRPRHSSIGFNQTIRQSWLGFTLDLVTRGDTPRQIRHDLNQLLKDQISTKSEARRNDRDKTISIILKMWALPDPAIDGLRRRCVQFHVSHAKSDVSCINYVMALATYPFCAAVAEIMGRLFRLQGKATPVEMQRRLRERFGQRSTVVKGGRSVLKSFIDWGFIKQAKERGAYKPASKKEIADPVIANLLLEALLHSTESGSGLYSSVTRSPVLFPFNVDITHGGAHGFPSSVEVIPHGWDDFILKLKQ